MTHRFLAKASAIALAASLAPNLALAQAAGAKDEIIVTGSFIKRQSQADLPSPLSTVAASDIADIGAQNIADITQTLTINTGSQNNPDAFTQNATTGTSNINLRGLGVGSTLVLMNGRRQVLSGSPTNDGVNFVDTSSLVPMIAIERVEILKDGASALYGSDAVAGVVNFITRDSYDGVLLSGNYNTHASEGNYNEYNIQGLAGKTFDWGSVMAAVSYTDRSPLTTTERRLSRPQDDTSGLGNPGAFFTTADNVPAPGVPAGTPLIDPGCATVGGFPTQASPTAPPPSTGIGFCGFDFGEFFNLVPDEERFVALLSGEVDITDSVHFEAEFTYADNTAERGNSPSFPFLQLGSAVVPSSAFGPAQNPFNIFGDTTLLFFGRASGNGGQVSPNNFDTETWRVAASLGGDVGSGAWELSFTRGSNEFIVATQDTVTDRFQCGLSGFNSIPAVPGLTGGTDCTAANPDLTTGGVTIPSVGTFFNPFSTSFSTAPNDPALLDYIIGTQVRTYNSDVMVVEGYISQDIFELPAGPVGLAVGGQYRDNDLTQNVDELSANDGFAFLVGGRDFEGSQDVFGFFGELSAPITSWADIQLAVRHERYGDEEGGSTTDPKIALLLRPHDRVSLRGSFSTSFRAPSVFQQVGEGTSLQQVTDPLNGTAFVAVRTLAPAGGRPIEPEESEAFNIGGSFEPIDGLKIDLDYFNFDFSNVIVLTSPQAILNADPMDPAVLRAPSAGGDGVILQINNDFVNASSVETSGLDFSVSYDLETSIGSFRPSFDGTYIINYDIDDPQAGLVEAAGVRNFNNFGSPTPEFRFNAGLSWTLDAHSANVFVRHIGSYQDDQNGLIDVDSDTRVDLQYALNVGELLQTGNVAQFTAGIRNVFDVTAPQVFTNGGFDSRVHDPRGRLVYFGVDVGF